MKPYEDPSAFGEYRSELFSIGEPKSIEERDKL
jgi:hypothetical protein